MTQLEKAIAMKCFGKMTEMVNLNLNRDTQDKLQEEYNCKNCDNFEYCCKLADTLS